LAELNNSPQYTKFQNSKRFKEWFECKILDATTNLSQWFSVLLSTKGQGTLDHGGGELVGKKFMVGQILEEFFKGESKINTMDGRRHSKPYRPNFFAK
jgi:hypothetical protein